jgi:hypothetical protein
LCTGGPGGQVEDLVRVLVSDNGVDRLRITEVNMADGHEMVADAERRRCVPAVRSADDRIAELAKPRRQVISILPADRGYQGFARGRDHSQPDPSRFLQVWEAFLNTRARRKARSRL